jgi:hypothetical protein
MNKIIVAFLLFIIALPVQVLAGDYNNIISDDDASYADSMTQVEIKDFLRSKNSFLANYWYTGDNPGPVELANDPEAEQDYIKKRSATEIIYNAGIESEINPQFLLTMLQKEMSLVEETSPTDNQLAYAMGYDCPDTGGCNFKTKGFGKQVRATAQQFRWYVDNINQYNWRPGVPACADDPNPFTPCTSRGTLVTPANAITAAMYLYTPHIHGNELFATLWDRYGFGGAPSNGTLTGIFPSGALIKAIDGEDIYLIADGVKRQFASMSALISRYDPQKVLAVEAAELEKYPVGNTISFMNYSVLEDADGNKYLIDGLQKRLIASDEAFRQLGFNSVEIEEVTTVELSAFANGADLDEDSSSPFAEVWQDMSTDKYFYIKDGTKAPLIDLTIVESNYSDFIIKEVTSLTLENLDQVAPMKLLDGTLIKKATDSKVYVISDGQRRLIPDEEVFTTLGYSWTNIITVPTKVMYFHAVGQELSL